MQKQEEKKQETNNKQQSRNERAKMNQISDEMLGSIIYYTCT